MKRKLLILFLAVITCITCAFGVAACTKNPDNGHSHTMTYHEMVNATCTTAGTKEYWSCSGCNKNFADSTGNAEISNLTIPATGHSFTDGICNNCHTDTNKYVTLVNLKNSQDSTKLRIHSDNHISLLEDIRSNPKSTLYIQYFYDKYGNDVVTDFTFTEDITIYCQLYTISMSDFNFSTASGKATITKVKTYTKNSQLVIIPRQYNGLPVTSIGSSAFSDGQMQEVVMFDEIQQIDSSAFYNCGGLTSVTMSKNVTSIGGYAFQNCSSLTSITIPEKVTSIGMYAFDDCSSLTSITIPEKITSIEYAAFFGCTKLNRVNVENLTNWCNIKFGGEYANPLYIAKNFYYKNQLIDELIIPNDVKTIRQYAFSGGTFKSIKVPETVTNIETGAFYRCSMLKKIQVPFVGNSYNSSARFGTIFGSATFPGGNHTGIVEFYSGTKYNSLIYQGEKYISYETFQTSFGTTYQMTYRGYYIPESLTEVIITNAQTIDKNSFYNCTFINIITINKSANFNGSFTNCNAEVLIK